MADLISSFTQNLLQGEAVENISKKLGLEPKMVQSIVSIGVPIIISGMSKMKSKEGGKASLASFIDADGDGSIMDDIGGFVMGAASEHGGTILNGIFGGKEEKVGKTVAKNTGAEPGMASQVMQMVAPIVLGYLNKKKNDDGLDDDGVGNLVDDADKNLRDKDAGIMDNIGKFLDMDGDGDMTDDVIEIGTNIFNFFNKDDDKK